jgi:hypothetical protein
MIKNVIFVLGLALSISCSMKNKIATKIYNKAIDISNIQGIWTDGQTENATFRINKDSIYYVDNFQSFKYEISSDTLIIKFDGFNDVSKIIKIDKDSLILFKDNQRLKFWKFKD